LSLSLRNPRRLIFAWLRCMGASARESRVSAAIYLLDVVDHLGLHQSGITSLCFVGCFSPGPRKNDLTIYWALVPFVRSFTPLVDPGDIYPPHTSLTPVSGRLALPPSRSPSRSTHLGWGTRRHSLVGPGTLRSRNADNKEARKLPSQWAHRIAWCAIGYSANNSRPTI
jgi:hypothetical protein